LNKNIFLAIILNSNKMELDEQPIGQATNKTGNDPFGSEFPDQPTGGSSSGGGGPLGTRIVSKKWNERAGAYEELSQLIKNITKSKDPLLYDHADAFKIYLKDSNPGALEKAVD
jgi:hypothetical protein